MIAPLVPLDSAVRLGGFAAVFAVMAIWEVAGPRRARDLPRRRRWPGNLGVVLLDTAVVRLIFPAGAVASALWAERAGLGLFNQTDAPVWIEALASIVLLDLAIWGQHVLFHRVPALWRLHRMHHTDLDVDVTTGVRFHPLEMLISMAIKVAVVAAIGAPAAAVVAFEVVLNATSLFNHADVRVPERLDRILRLLVVTPDMHRVHHSTLRPETDSNFGFNTPWWDRLFGTYRAQPQDGHDGMTLGVEGFQDPRELRLDRMLLQPLRSPRAAGASGSFSPSRGRA